MSNPEARREALEAQKLKEKSQRMQAAIALEARRPEQQGAALGFMVSGFGGWVGSNRMQAVVSGIRITLLTGAGALALYALYLKSL